MSWKEDGSANYMFKFGSFEIPPKCKDRRRRRVEAPGGCTSSNPESNIS